MQGKSTLHFMDQTTLKIGSTHPHWTSLSSKVSSVKKGTIKARLLTGTYLLETNKHKFSSGKESPLCKCCGMENEDVTHFLLLCPVLYKQRKESFPKIKTFGMISLIAGADPGFQIRGGGALKKNCAERREVRKILWYFV